MQQQLVQKVFALGPSRRQLPKSKFSLRVFESRFSSSPSPPDRLISSHLKMSGFDPPVDCQPEASLSMWEITAVTDSSMTQVVNDRLDYVKKRMKENREKVLDATNNLYKLSMEKGNLKSVGVDGSLNLLAKRQKEATDMHNSSSQEDGYASSAILFGSTIAVKNAVCPIMLPKVNKIP